MFSTPPPRTKVKSRSERAHQRDKLKTVAHNADEVLSTRTCPPTVGQLTEAENQTKKNYSLLEKVGSVKTERAPGSSKKSCRSSIEARKKQLELEAAEAKARIDKELIDKKLAADFAALDDQVSNKSRYSDEQSISRSSRKVEQWLEKSVHEPAIDLPLHELPSASAAPVPAKEMLQLTQAIANLATVTNNANTKFLSRLATSKDLSPFFGEPLEWLQFKRSYEESTRLCNYSDSENLARLNRCLRGEARDAVSSLLISDTTPNTIVEALELRFGRPELIIYKLASQFKRLPTLSQNYHSEIVSFAVKIKNYVAAAQSINQSDYLRSPDLLNSVLSKCPATLLNKWADYICENNDSSKAKLQIFSEYLHQEASKIATAGISHIHTLPENKTYKKSEERRVYSHAVLNSDSNSDAKCKFCRTYVHTISSCAKFKRALRTNKWRFVKINRLCHKCLLSGHGKETCPAAPCDVDKCGLPHHHLLHWPHKESSSSSNNAANKYSSAPQLITVKENEPSTSETVTNTIAARNNTSVMLKIVRVNLHGPAGVVTTHALLDDGATVSLVSADLANSINLQGQPETLRMRGAWNSDIICNSEIVNFKLSNSRNQMYEMRARKISELDLPKQKLSKVNLGDYEHLRDLKDYVTCDDIKPELLIGQDNFHLIMTLKTIHRNMNEPCATLTPLGWCLHGIVPACSRNLLLTTEHALTTALFEPHDPLTSLISGSRGDSAVLMDCIPTTTHTCAAAHTTPGNSNLQQLNDAHSDKALHELVQRSFAIDAIGVSSKARVNKDDIRAVSIIDNSARLINGRYEVALPWKNYMKMPNSYSNAYKRFLTVERKMLACESYAVRYKDRINHLFENEYARLLSGDELLSPHNRIWYIPHLGVDNPNKKKLRLVYDCSATTAGWSLNDYLLQGPDLLQSLLGIMLRFREKPVAIMGDIKDYYLRIKINKEDQHALRFLWRENVNSELKTYVMTSLPFGTKCSSFIAQHIKNKNAMRFQKEMPEAVDAILKSHYMDDYIESVDCSDSAMKMIREVSKIHIQGGFEIRDWVSNKQDVLECTPKETLSDKSIRFKTGCDDLPERALGLLWFPLSDTFGFDLSLKRVPSEITKLERKPTKRELLRIHMSIFDIFGFLAPFTVKSKIMLQNIWKTGIRWDDEIPTKEYNVFRSWITELQSLQRLRIPRFYFQCAPVTSERDNVNNAHCSTACQNETTIELHVFCDASPAACAAVAYWREISKDSEVCVSFIASKCRASPVKKYITIPKLELQSCLIGCRLADTIAHETRLNAYKRYFWTDSLIVLHQIKNDTRNYKVFVANRLGEIDELSQTQEWNYIPTHMNIADKATKLNTYELSNDCEWLRGPNFLYLSQDDWPKYDPKKEKINNDQLLQVNTTQQMDNESLPVVPDLTKFSSWIRLWRCMANVLLFIKKCKMPRNAPINTEIMQRSETELLRYSQTKTFPDEIYALKNNMPIKLSSRLRKLTPTIDEQGLLRVGGRIQAASGIDSYLKQPIILDGHDIITRLIVKRYHEMAAHGNNETIVNDIRQKYWVVNLRPTVRTVASRCLVCRIRKAKPTNPRMGDLPAARLAHHQRPFTHCGVDLFGHMEVTVGRRYERRYGVLFTCMTIRAIHIELVPSLSADSFIMALRRMAARRGWPFRMYSDNATNLRGTEAELRRSFREINNHDSVNDVLITRQLEWHFISPASPHMGGAWERLVRSVKTALKVVLKERAPREEVLSTLMTEVENIVNSRPLSYVSTDHCDPETLTPNHFLLGSSSNLPVPGVFEDSDLFRKKMWRITERLTDMFWKRWMREVLPTLLPRQKWFEEGHQLKEGDVVVIIDPNSPRNTWPKGRIKKVHPGADGRVRIVDVKTKAGVFTRPVARLALLPTSTDDNCPERTMGVRM